MFPFIVFLTLQRIISTDYMPQTCEDLVHRVTVVGLILAIFFFKNVKKIFRRRDVPSILTAFKWITRISNFIIN